MVTYAKLRDGSWGLKGSEDEVQPGKIVTVNKRDGSSKRETVGRVLWTGDGSVLATIARDDEPSTAAPAKPARQRRGRLSDDDRCEVCDGNKWTCGHCVGW